MSFVLWALGMALGTRREGLCLRRKLLFNKGVRMRWLRQGQWGRTVIRSVVSVVLLASTTMAGQNLPPEGEPSPDASTLVYRLRAGESLSDIAQLFHVSLEELTQLNQIADPRRVPVGQ